MGRDAARARKMTEPANPAPKVAMPPMKERQPAVKSIHATSREKCLVIIRHEIRDIQTGAVVEEDSRPFSASFAESNKFQGFTFATRA